MDSINIPPAALEAGARAMCHNAYKHLPEMRDQDTYTPDADYWLDQARAAFVAMVKAWEGANTTERVLVDDYYEGILKTETFLTLPLPPPPAGETNEV